MITPEKDFEVWVEENFPNLDKLDKEYKDLKDAFLAGAQSTEEYLKNALELNISAFNRALAKDLLKLEDKDKIIEELKEIAEQK